MRTCCSTDVSGPVCGVDERHEGGGRSRWWGCGHKDGSLYFLMGLCVHMPAHRSSSFVFFFLLSMFSRVVAKLPLVELQA